MMRSILLLLILAPAAEVVSFPSSGLTLRGVLYRPEGTGPFPAVVYNHGSAMDSSAAIEGLGRVFADRGWVFFAPYRDGQGVSASAGPYLMDEIRAAFARGGVREGAATLVRLLETDHLNDQLAGLAWLRQASFVKPDRIAVIGNSFGGNCTWCREGYLLRSSRCSRCCPELVIVAGVAGPDDPGRPECESTNRLLPSGE